MEQLVYISTCRSALGPSSLEIQGILELSRRNNARDGLSGLLIVGGRRFLQVLEGPSEALDRAYRRIESDTRHFAMVQLARKVISKRSFPGWDMGYEIDGIGLTSLIAGLTGGVADPSLRAQLEGFAALHSRAA